MGIYLDSKTAYALYRKEIRKPYFVDKTKMLEELISVIREGGGQYLYHKAP